MKKLLRLLPILLIPFLSQAVTTKSIDKPVEANVIHKDDDKKSKTKKWKKELKEIRKSQPDQGKKNQLIFATVLVGIAAMIVYAMLILALEISFGLTPLFVFLFLFGWGAIIFGMVRIIKRIKKKYSTG